MSSPGDAALLRKKKRINKEKTKSVKKAPEFFGNTVQMCEEGLSPKVAFTRNYGKSNKNDDDTSDD